MLVIEGENESIEERISDWPDTNKEVCLIKDKAGRLVPMIKMRENGGNLLSVKYNKNIPDANKEVDAEAAERFKRAREILKLPMAVAIYVSIDKTIDLENGWEIPDELAPVPVLVSIAGESATNKGELGVGKSTLTAWLSLKTGYPVIDFETIYEEKATTYLEKVSEGVRLERVEEFVDLISNAESTIKERVQEFATPFHQKMIEVVNFFKSSSERKEVYLCDMPGAPRIERDNMGNITSFGRQSSLYDFFALFSCELAFFTTRRILFQSKYSGSNRQFDRKVEEIIRKIDDYKLKIKK